VNESTESLQVNADAPADATGNGPDPASVSGVSEEQIVEILKTIYDPEIPVNIYDMGLIYGIEIRDDGWVDIEMTLTSPACPVAGTLPPEVEAKVRDGVEGIVSAKVEIVWDPPWTPEKMTDAAKLQLGME
jgi:FeS assembly SUF system protein